MGTSKFITKSKEEYINRMGPVWELDEKYTAFNDSLEAALPAVVMLGILAAGTCIGMAIEGAGIGVAGGILIAKGVETGVDLADAAISAILGDKLGASIALASVFLPEAGEQLMRGAKSTSGAISKKAFKTSQKIK